MGRNKWRQEDNKKKGKNLNKEDNSDKFTGKVEPSSNREGKVKSHTNLDGPICFKCAQVCKDISNLKNHVLSHYYQDFYAKLPSNKPFECPICNKPNRDRITLVIMPSHITCCTNLRMSHRR